MRINAQTPFLLTFALALAVFASACAMRGEATGIDPATPGSEQVAPPLTCRTAADCVVKDVGNCCGYFPACVHRDQPVDPAAVKAQCARDGRAGICGFPEISSCVCVEGQCMASPAQDGGDPT